MSFLDKKEEVLDIKLTRYGKDKLMEGEWNPSFYSFHDDGILYDSKNGGFSEDTNDSESRIAKDTVYLEAQSLYSSKADEIKDDPDREEELQTKNKIGTADLQGDKAPALQLDVLEGKIQDFSDVSGSLSGSTNTIPQVNINPLEYEVSIASSPQTSNKNIKEFGEPDAGVIKQTFDDGTSIEVDPKHVLFAIQEQNVPISNESFELEVFEIEEKDNGENEMSKLSFIENTQEAFQEIFEPKGSEQTQQELTSDFVEYFLDIEVDSEIDREELCKKLSNNENAGKFKEELECGDFVANDNVSDITDDRYESNVDSDDLGEKCP